MAGSKGDAAAKRRRMAAGPGRLLPELLANIHDRLGFPDRISFAAVFAASCNDDDDVFKPCVPCLLLPRDSEEENPATATLFSVADRCAATVRAADPALRGHFVLGSSRGWLATADNRGRIYVVNPATGEQCALPDITTMGCFLSRQYDHWFTVWIQRFLTARFGGGPPFGDNCWGSGGYGSRTINADEMRGWFYRKIVLSSTSPRRRPAGSGSYAAMLILTRDFGAPAFATSEDGASWRLAPSRDGVEHAIHNHEDGRFYSVSYTGVVEAWERDAESGAYASTAVTPRLLILTDGRSRRYLAAAPDGRLMVVVKYVQVTKDEQYSWKDRWTCSFKVHVVGDDGQWEETNDIGDIALFVGMNNSLCVPTAGRPEMEAGCIYYTDDELRDAVLRKREETWRSSSYRSRDDDESGEVRAVGVYSVKHGTLKRIEALGQEQYRRFSSMPPVWITPSTP